MAATARVFWSGNSQAVRLPRAYRFPAGVVAVTVSKEGDKIVMQPPRQRRFSSRFWKALGSLPAFKRPHQVRQRRKKIFP